MNKYIRPSLYYGIHMLGVVRYTTFTIFFVSLIMLSAGLIPQTFAGTVLPPNTIDSTITLEHSCGLNVSGSADFGQVSRGATVFNTDVVLSNGGSGTALITANVGTSLVSSSLAGGYAGATDQTTHIPPREVTLQIDDQGRVAMNDSGANAMVGELRNTDPGILEVGVNINPINLPTSDPVWIATFELTVFDCVLG